MRIAIFCHSLLSDWNHGNAHFLRGVASSSLHGASTKYWYSNRGIPGASRHLLPTTWRGALVAMKRTYPLLDPHRYDPQTIDLSEALDGVDAVWFTSGMIMI